MEITSRSFNYATRQYEDWGVSDCGHAVIFTPDNRQLEFELEFPPPIQQKPPRPTSESLATDECTCANCQ